MSLELDKINIPSNRTLGDSDAMAQGSRKKIRISEVAEKAGTSLATVSYVLNEKGSVSNEMRAKVLSAARALGYKSRPRVPRKGSRGLKKLSLVWVNTSPHWQQSYLANLLNHTIATCLSTFGGELRTTFHNEYSQDVSPILSGEEDGLLIAGRPTESFCEKIPSRLPRLNIICQPYPTDTPFLDIDHISVGRQQTDYLIRLGHRKIGFISNDRNHPYFEQKHIGYCLAMNSAELEMKPEWILRIKEKQSVTVETSEPIQSLEEQLNVLFSGRDVPTAFVTANDWVAGALYQFAQRKGYHVPRDFSIIGCDNDPNICSLLQPHLTTFITPYEEIGREAVHWIRSMVEGRPAHSLPGVFLIQGKLIERESCQKFPSSL